MANGGFLIDEVLLFRSTVGKMGLAYILVVGRFILRILNFGFDSFVKDINIT